MPKAQKPLSFKRMQISKANTTMVASVAVAIFVFIFSIFAAKALLAQRSYYSRVISKKDTAKKQLAQNIQARDALETSYKAFMSNIGENIIDGNPTGEGERDGDNARIVLDALPSKYDFPALATSIEKLLTNQALIIEGISGSDDELAQQALEVDTPTPIDIPFNLAVGGDYAAIQALTEKLSLSIRPVHILRMALAGSDGSLKLELSAKTYYQPEKKINIKLEEVQ